MDLNIDINNLLEPCTTDTPCGEDTRLDTSPQSPYFSLKDLRQQARALERNSMMDDDPQTPEQWRQLLRLLPEALKSTTKDLEFITWLIEALAREYGFIGLRLGFSIARQLIETYWDTIHPLPEAGDYEQRIASLAGLNGYDNDGTLIQPILTIPIIISRNGEKFATWECEQSIEINRLDKAKAEKRILNGACSPEVIAQTAREMTDEDIIAVSSEIQSTLNEFNLLITVVDNLSGVSCPSSRIVHTLQRCLDAFNFQLGHRLKDITVTPLDPIDDDTDKINTVKIDLSNHYSNTLENREQAVNDLRRLADIFRKMEPHSPISYVIEQAVRWSQMSLPELMNELIDDTGARSHFCRLTGVSTPQD